MKRRVKLGLLVSAMLVLTVALGRYAWEHSPRFELRHDEGWITHGLLFNGEGLPAAPFRTDAWPRAARGDGR